MNEETKEVLNVVKDMFSMLNGKMDEMQKDISEVKQRVANVENRLTNVESKVTKIETTLENETNRNIKLLVDGYTTNTEKLDKIEPTLKQVKEKTDIIELAVKSHSHDIGYLKKVK